MKEMLQQLAAYHIWANNALLDTVKKLPEDDCKKETPSSFNSLQKTVVHMWNSEAVWWQRMKLQERIIEPKDNFNGATADAIDSLLQQNKQWIEWINNAQEHHLDHVFQYRNFKGEQFKQPLFQMFLHVFNHGTYHRGQIVTMLRQLGIEKIPPTDFIVWSRRKI